jgi:23S rRNA (cytosine1962-C5)-methyltransferase
VLNRHRHRLLEGHLWVFRNEIERVEGDPVPGDAVAVRDGRGRCLAVGYWNPASQITVRVLARGERAVDDALLRERLDTAIAHRERALPAAWSCRRLVNSEADLLPGLIVDRYGERVVFQLTTLGMDRRRGAIIAALQAALHPAQLIERSDVPVRALEGLEPVAGVIAGGGDGRCEITVGAARFACDLLDPHKTGFYLDQQANYAAVAARCRPGMRVLDVCCHLGGFAIHAALAGAEAIGIDTAPDSVAAAAAAAALSGVETRAAFVCANAFDELNRRQGLRERFDLIILDPPTFARDRAAVAGALRGYKELHLRALRLLPVGGVLATFSCSHHVDAEAFLGTVLEAAADAGVTLRREALLGASPDHPVLPSVPESEYLKGVVFTVIERWR